MSANLRPPSAEEEARWYPIPEYVEETINDESFVQYGQDTAARDAFITGATWALMRERYIRSVRPEYRNDVHWGREADVER